MNQNKKYILIGIIIGVSLTLLITLPLRSLVSAEQSGTTPNSGATSYIKNLYDSLVSLGNGSDSSGSWGDWGGTWNRIRSSSEWVPSGDATAGDVVGGKTFYGDNRTQITGTGPAPTDYSLMQFNEYDDYEGLTTGSIDPTNPVDDYEGEEAVWTNTSTNVWKDERTGLYWSADVSTLGLGLPAKYSNSFPNQVHSTCPFFSSNPRGSYDGLTSACGNAINVCGTLLYDRNNDGVAEIDWYLPTQKELQMAYIDGMYNQAGAGTGQTKLTNAATFTTSNYFWSSSEVSNVPAAAWGVPLGGGGAGSFSKTAALAVRCVARD